MYNPFDFNEKKIVVTGSTSGIGKETALILSQQGARVCLVGRRSDALQNVIEEMSGSGHMMYIKDFSTSDGYKEMFDYFVSDGVKIDGIAHCAGIARILPLAALNYSNMEECMRINLYSMVQLVGLFAKKKYHSLSASFVTVSSVAANYPGKCQSIYAASKAAVNNMTQSLAMELAAKDVRINAVMPGSVNTRMMTEANANRSEELFDKEMKKQLLGLEEPSDIANVIMFLLSDASSKITGRSIYADGGYINF